MKSCFVTVFTKYQGRLAYIVKTGFLNETTPQYLRKIQINSIKKPKSKNSKAYSRLNILLCCLQLAKFIIFLSNVLGWSESCIFGIGIYHWSFGC